MRLGSEQEGVRGNIQYFFLLSSKKDYNFPLLPKTFSEAGKKWQDGRIRRLRRGSTRRRGRSPARSLKLDSQKATQVSRENPPEKNIAT